MPTYRSKLFFDLTLGKQQKSTLFYSLNQTAVDPPQLTHLWGDRYIGQDPSFQDKEQISNA